MTTIPLILASLALAQTGGGRPEPIVSPEIASDNRVTFRIRAPKAQEVLVSASIGTLNPKPAGAVKEQPGMWNIPMHKDATGLWTVTIGPLDPDVYRYVFFVDGVRGIDQANRAPVAARVLFAIGQIAPGMRRHPGIERKGRIGMVGINQQAIHPAQRVW